MLLKNIAKETLAALLVTVELLGTTGKSRQASSSSSGLV